MSTFYFVAGASGSGKTAILSDLKKILGKAIAVYDFDDIGVPKNADKKWRQEATQKWLEKLLNEGEDACLLGQIVLGEILACPAAKQIAKMHFYLLDVCDFERIQRLKKRNTYGMDQNMLNWSSWLRMHHQDPQWMQHVLKEDCWSGLDFSSWDQLSNWDDKARVSILDTTQLSINQVAGQVANWIDVKNTEMPEFSQFDLAQSTIEERDFIDNLIVDYNLTQVSSTQKELWVPLNYCFKHKGTIIAGINADMYLWNIVYLNILFVDEAYRHLGLGSSLLNKVETQARLMGAELVHLDTFDFQAKDFYIKQGYEVFGVLDDCPKGHKRYYMKKILSLSDE